VFCGCNYNMLFVVDATQVNAALDEALKADDAPTRLAALF